MPTNEKKTKTIVIERKNREGKVTAKIVYAKVSDRVAEFNKAGKGSIKTEYFLQSPIVIFRATVIPDVDKPEHFFTGTSFGKIGDDKALEKIETLAVGRALAFAGYLSTGEIASYEEMERYEKAIANIDIAPAIERLNKTKNIEELAKIWRSLSEDERRNKMIEEHKNVKKKEFETIQIEEENEKIKKVEEETGLSALPEEQNENL
jgi:hypothetical protein